MKTATITKTIRFLPEDIATIESIAQEEKTSFTKALQRMIELAKKRRRQKLLEEELKILSKDEAFQKECVWWAELNLD
ncbi:MAG: hypothetical protein Q8O95_04475 [bacterium]|nr:hypothetical protein [bacterium]